jgi:hypothetical protein
MPPSASDCPHRLVIYTSADMTLTGGTLEIASTGRLGGGAYAANITNNATFVCKRCAEHHLP